MTELLQKAFAKASTLPPEQQDALASLLLEEIDSERRWDDLFARSQDQLAAMADQALAEFEAGNTTPLFSDETS